jgi:HK97 gp10 family phage protein
MAEIRIKGLSELQKQLSTIAPRLEANIIRGALRQGAKPIAEAARKNAPVGEPSESAKKRYKVYAGALRDSIRVGARIDRRNGQVVAYIRAGGRIKKNGAIPFYAHFLEYGVRPHRISGKTTVNGNTVPAIHPGISPRPYMRPALDAEAKNAVIAAGEYIKKRLATKEGLNTADIDIGIDDE